MWNMNVWLKDLVNITPCFIHRYSQRNLVRERKTYFTEIDHRTIYMYFGLYIVLYCNIFVSYDVKFNSIFTKTYIYQDTIYKYDEEF